MHPDKEETLLLGISVVVLLSMLGFISLLVLQGCSTMDSFGESGNCKASVQFECDCNCKQDGIFEETVGIIK